MSELFTTDTIGFFLEQIAEKYPDHEYLLFPGQGVRWSFSEFNTRVDRLARGLLQIGVRPGAHVGIWANNIPDWLTFYFATAKIGAVLVMVNTSFKLHDVNYVIADSEMKVLAFSDGFRDVDYPKILFDLIPETLGATPRQLQSSRFGELKTLIHFGPQGYPGVFNLDDVFRLGDHFCPHEYRKVVESVSCHDIVNIQYTSGTTGFPKGVMLTHHNILNNGYYVGQRQRLTSEDRICLPVPLFHCFGATLGALTAMVHHASLVILKQFNITTVLNAIQNEKCTALYGVPSMFIAELNHPSFDKYDLSSLRTGVMSGAPCPMEIMHRVMNEMHMKEITIAYGLTEASPIFTQTATDDPIIKRVETVGKKHPCVEVKIVDPVTGKTLGPGKTGEICCRGYSVMKGYYRKPEETAKILDEDGWLHSGDLGEVDEDGYYRITGRLKDIIIRSGENIPPREIEEFLFTLDGVQDAQVVGVPDKKRGEIVVAFVICKPGFLLDEYQLRKAMLKEMAEYKVPRHFFFMNEFPLTTSGKVQKYKLRRLAMDMLGVCEDTPFDLPS